VVVLLVEDGTGGGVRWPPPRAKRWKSFLVVYEDTYSTALVDVHGRCRLASHLSTRHRARPGSVYAKSKARFPTIFCVRFGTKHFSCKILRSAYKIPTPTSLQISFFIAPQIYNTNTIRVCQC
jgi:hypothetical protein